LLPDSVGLQTQTTDTMSSIGVFPLKKKEKI
jgi:hypothetical protein